MPDHKPKRLAREDFVHALNEIGSWRNLPVGFLAGETEW